MPVAKGLFKTSDELRFGKLFYTLENMGAYMIAYSPKKSQIYAWFKGKDVEEKLGDLGVSFEVKKGRNGNFTMVSIIWNP